MYIDLQLTATCTASLSTAHWSYPCYRDLLRAWEHRDRG
jgi:hypothetical protein